MLPSEVVHFSIYHSHRQFPALYGISLYSYIQLLRLKRASYQLAYRTETSILQIALDSHYESPEAFSRAFKQQFGQTPTAFRHQPDWPAWHLANHATLEPKKQTMTLTFTSEQISIVDFPATSVALLTHHGAPALIGDTIRNFIAFRRQNNFHPSQTSTFNLLYTDPETVDPADYRLDICVTAPHPIAPNEQGVIAATIPAGRCAVLRQIGTSDDFHPTVSFLYSQWLPQSGEELRDYPIYAQRVTFFPEVPEHEAITDIFLPLK